MSRAQQDIRVWITTGGVPAVTRTSNGAGNAERWEYTPAFVAPKVPDDAVIEAIKRAIYGQIAFRGGDEEHYESVRGGIYDAAARAAYAALSGATQ